ncbi:hypothetical protein [uncultured Duncaniella sp.]|uniref:hypothetical protein n=1 Tax=uncultured Duncaniella sp. TaxID=2768039 RepID=UPI00260AF0BC|nr:hypothetical protein [uncultured Duncaniella sp.]
MKRTNNPSYISLPGKIVLIICAILSVLFLFKVASIGNNSTNRTSHTDAPVPMSKVESVPDSEYTFTEITIAKEEFVMSTTRIVKFSFSEVLYIVNSYGGYEPLLNEDGSPMTLTQFEEVMSDGRN